MVCSRRNEEVIGLMRAAQGERRCKETARHFGMFLCPLAGCGCITPRIARSQGSLIAEASVLSFFVSSILNIKAASSQCRKLRWFAANTEPESECKFYWLAHTGSIVKMSHVNAERETLLPRKTPTRRRRKSSGEWAVSMSPCFVCRNKVFSFTTCLAIWDTTDRGLSHSLFIIFNVSPKKKRNNHNIDSNRTFVSGTTSRMCCETFLAPFFNGKITKNSDQGRRRNKKPKKRKHFGRWENTKKK